MRKSALLAFGLVVTALVALGLLVVSTAAEANAIRIFHNPYHFLARQATYVGLGIVLATGVAFFDYRKWRDHWLLTAGFAGVVFVLLLVVFKFKELNGSARWIDLGPVNLQPSELAKLAMVILMSVWLDRSGWRVERWKHGFLFPCLFIGAFCLPIMKEPDFGSTIVVGAVACLVMLLAGVRWRCLAIVAIVGACLVGWKVAENPNRMARMAAWFGVKLQVGAQVLDAAAKNAEWQGKQALVAIHNGGIGGVGLGNSLQKHYYLPEAHTDMIFAIGAEELGLWFSVFVIVLFLSFFALSIYIAYRSRDRLGRYIVFGMAFLIFFQAMFNIGVVCEALPMKGMALPFFSYGGTNMLSAFFAVGTILSVGIHSYRDGKHRASAALTRTRDCV